MNENDELASFWDHLEALRKIAIKILFIWGLATLIAFFFFPQIYTFLKTKIPESQAFVESLKMERMEKIRLTNETHLVQKFVTPSGEIHRINSGESIEYWSPQPMQILLLSPLEGIATSLKLSFWLGIFITSPFWLYQIFLFLKPGLNPREYQLILPFFSLSIFFLILGGLFCYAITLPLANQYFVYFNQEMGTNAWSLSQYIDYSLILFLANGLAFEGAALFLLLIHFGILSADFMKKKRKLFAIVFLILGAVLTPPDVITQLLLALPLMLFYEIGILYARLRSRNLINGTLNI